MSSVLERKERCLDAQQISSSQSSNSSRVETRLTRPTLGCLSICPFRLFGRLKLKLDFLRILRWSSSTISTLIVFNYSRFTFGRPPYLLLRYISPVYRQTTVLICSSNTRGLRDLILLRLLQLSELRCWPYDNKLALSFTKLGYRPATSPARLLCITADQRRDCKWSMQLASEHWHDECTCSIFEKSICSTESFCDGYLIEIFCKQQCLCMSSY